MSATMWKAPTRREYAPKPMDPGQVVVWTVVIPARWEVEPTYGAESGVYTEGTGWTPPATYERIGTIWSAGFRPNTWWVVPDDDMLNPVLVMSTRPKGEGELYQDSAGDGWRDRIRRAENVRRRGVFPVVESVTESRSWSGRGSERTSVIWHADQECSEAAGKERFDVNAYADGMTGPGYATWTALTIADVMIGRTRLSSPGPFCPRCVMLEPEPARELVTA